jgi:hypothetical protein
MKSFEDLLSEFPACQTNARRLVDLLGGYEYKFGYDADGGIGICAESLNHKKFITMTCDEEGDAWVCFHGENNEFDVIPLEDNDLQLKEKINQFII